MYHVLIVDDEKYIRRSIINRIDWEKCGGEVIGEAADGEEAYEMIGLYQPEVVITDIRMPGMDGLKLAEIVSREYPHIKLVLISAYNDFEYARKAIQYGVKEYLLKPVMEEEMEEVLIRLEKERKQSEKNYSVPEISGYTAAQEEFTGGRFLVTSFYMPEIKDEVQRREGFSSFIIYCQLIRKVKRSRQSFCLSGTGGKINVLSFGMGTGLRRKKSAVC